MVPNQPRHRQHQCDTDSGYDYIDTTIHGFSLTHLSVGTVCPDLGDFCSFRRWVNGFCGRRKDHAEEGFNPPSRPTTIRLPPAITRVKLTPESGHGGTRRREQPGILPSPVPRSTRPSVLTDLATSSTAVRWHVAESRLLYCRRYPSGSQPVMAGPWNVTLFCRPLFPAVDEGKSSVTAKR